MNSTLRELEEYGYLTRSQKRLKNGRMGETEYVIYEMPDGTVPDADLPGTGSPYTEKPDTAESCTENPREINKDRTRYVVANRDGNPLSYSQFKGLWKHIMM